MFIRTGSAMRSPGMVLSHAGLHRFAPRQVVRCSSVAEVRHAVGEASRAGLRIRPLGTAQSWSPCLVTDDVSINVEALRSIRVDARRGTVTAGAGARLGDVTLALAAHGLCLRSLPFLAEMTVGGAVATASHGTSPHSGTLSDFVRSIELVAADGETWRFGADGETDELRAARACVGLLGVITSVELDAAPIPWVRPGVLTTDLATLPTTLETLAADRAHLWGHWRLGGDTVELRFLDRVPPGTPDAHPYVVGRNARWTPPGRRLDRIMPGWSDRLRTIHRKRHATGTPQPGAPLRVSMQYALPRERMPEALDRLRRSGFAAANADRILELKFLARSDRTFLAPNSGQDAVLFNAYWLVEPGRRFAALQPLEEIMRALGGRPHWGKLHRRPDSGFMRRSVPEWWRFDRIRRAMDPAGPFSIFPNELEPGPACCLRPPHGVCGGW